MWQIFLTQYNGYSYFSERRIFLGPIKYIGTDACPLGAGGIYGRFWFQYKHKGPWVGLNICVLEMYPIFEALYVFRHQIKGERVIIRTDNMAVMTTINKKSCKHPLMMAFMRKISLLSLRLKIKLSATYISTKNNYIPDLISRYALSLQIINGYSMAPSPVVLPSHISPEFCGIE